MRQTRIALISRRLPSVSLSEGRDRRQRRVSHTKTELFRRRKGRPVTTFLTVVASSRWPAIVGSAHGGFLGIPPGSMTPE